MQVINEGKALIKMWTDGVPVEEAALNQARGGEMSESKRPTVEELRRLAHEEIGRVRANSSAPAGWAVNAIADRLAEAERERDEALMLANGPSTLKLLAEEFCLRAQEICRREEPKP